MQIYHEFDYKGRHYKLVHDEDYQTVGSFAYETAKETKAAEDKQIAKLDSGEWVVLGCIVTAPCEGGTGNSDEPASHCRACSGSVEVDSLWGIVVENDTRKIERVILVDILGVI